MVIRWAYIVVVSLCFIWLTITSPLHNWDMIGYSAAVYDFHGLSGAELLASTFSDVRTQVADHTYNALTNANDNYRLTVASSPAALEQQVPFYQIRVIYLLLISSFGWLFGSVAFATSAVSAIASGLIVFLAGCFLRHCRSWFLFLSFPIVISVVVMEAARLSTADALAALGVISAFLLLHRSQLLASCLLICLLPLFRTDFVILSLLCGLYFLIDGKARYALLTIAVSTGLYFAVNHIVGNYGYQTIFNFTLVTGPVPFPATLEVNAPWHLYVTIYQNGLLRLLSLPDFYLAFAVLPLLLLRQTDRILKPAVVICFAFIIAHFTLFPAAFARNYMPFVLMALIFIAKSIDDILQYKISDADDRNES